MELSTGSSILEGWAVLVAGVEGLEAIDRLGGVCLSDGHGFTRLCFLDALRQKQTELASCVRTIVTLGTLVLCLLQMCVRHLKRASVDPFNSLRPGRRLSGSCDNVFLSSAYSPCQV